MKTIVTRETILGWGFSTFNGGVKLPEQPIYTGTLSTIENETHRDVNLKTLNVEKSQAWFVSIDGDWRRIKKVGRMQELLDKLPWGGYTIDEVEVELDSTYEIAKAASALGSIKTAKKARSSAENGKLGGRPDKRIGKANDVDPNRPGGWIVDMSVGAVNPDCYWRFGTMAAAKKFLALVDGGMPARDAYQLG